MPDDISDELRVKLAAAIESLRKAEARALAGQFAVEIMHEVRNPLEALGYLVHLAAQEDDVETIRAYLRQANEQIATVSEIAAQTLGFVKNAPQAHVVDLTALVEAALRIHHRRIATQKIHLVRDFEDDVTAEIYSGAILQVLSNLLANALDALPQEGTISLRLRKRGARVQVLIADNGSGMEHTQAARLFEPYFSTKENRGTGLGLALSKKIVERHNGQICARSSTAPGRCGTTFKMTLPRQMVASVAPQEEQR